MGNKQYSRLERISYKVTHWIGSPTSVILHTTGFIGCFVLVPFIGLDRVMLGLTTVVSLEAIYLSLFIQITVNRQTEHIKDVKEDIADIQENVEDLQEENIAE